MPRLPMMKNENGSRMVTMKSAAGISLASAGACLVLVTSTFAFLGLPTPAQYLKERAELHEQQAKILDRIDDIYRLLRAFGISDDEISRRMEEAERRGRSRPIERRIGPNEEE